MRSKTLGVAVFLIIMLLAAGCTSQQAAPETATPQRPAHAPISPSMTASEGTTSALSLPNDSEMKVIGMIAGVSWASSADYYRYMNEKAQNDLGGLHSARVLMYSIEFDEFSKQERLADAGDWEPLNNTLVDSAQRLKRGGADFIIIGSNTLNSRADLIEEKTGLMVLRIYDATGAKVNRSGFTKVALLGTKYTMEQPFYRDALEQKYGVAIVIPNATERDYINTVIFDELCRNEIRNESRDGFVRIINRLADEEGAQGVILGCTEIPLLIHQGDVTVPVFDTTRIHAEAAVDYALGRTSP
ncbi:MAG TPA: aspartate/glutamate racemase family protein [Methanoregulaceae archaeon]|nr:aspartate/glutamate racemase family protein [Methanoregulaceae archaeon]HPD74480.1 aspartate/glutamate racemase family protein [Methanoregulaceae archaeon]